MQNVCEVIKRRRSVRTFDGQLLKSEDIARLEEIVKASNNPFGVPIDLRFFDADKNGLSSQVIQGASKYLVGKVTHVPLAEEAFGYQMEQVLLEAESIGVGTVWLAGTMNRPAFESAIEVAPNEMMPAVSPLGYAAKRQSIRERAMRRGVKADTRFPFGELFFEDSFDKPLTEELAGRLLVPLQMVRLAPSAVNRQPWRVVVEKEGKVNFYLSHYKNMSNKLGDIQRVDMGIAMCHFDLVTRELGIEGSFEKSGSDIDCPDGVEYIMSWKAV